VGFMDFERVGVGRVVVCDKQVHKGCVEVMAVDNLEIKNVGGGEKKGKKKENRKRKEVVRGWWGKKERKKEKKKKEREGKYNGNRESVGGK
jgi:hypothetical protein